jgi:hypothetical protein
VTSCAGSRMTDPVRDSPCSLRTSWPKILILRQFNFGIKLALGVLHGELRHVTPRRRQGANLRPPGRPSTVAPFAPQITQWLRETPWVSGVEILRRVQLAGYRGGKSALYELVKRLRPSGTTVRVKTSPSNSETHSLESIHRVRVRRREDPGGLSRLTPQSSSRPIAPRPLTSDATERLH